MIGTRSAVFALGLTGGLLMPAPRVPPPLTARYHVATQTVTIVDLSVFGQPSQEIRVAVDAWVSLSLADTAGGRLVHLVVDSLRYQGTQPQLTQEMADSARGGTVHGFLAPDGRVRDLKPTPESNIFMGEMPALVHALFPRIRPGSRPGDGWSDTLEVANTAAGANVLTRSLIRYTMAAPGMTGGSPATRLEAQSQVAVRGTIQSPQAGAMELEGQGTSADTLYVNVSDGLLGGSSSTLKLTQAVRMAMAPAPIPIVVTAGMVITRLP